MSFKLDSMCRAKYGDPPADDPVAHLRHVLTVFMDSPDDREILTATRGAYIDRDWTGLTFGDLRGVLEEIESAD